MVWVKPCINILEMARRSIANTLKRPQRPQFFPMKSVFDMFASLQLSVRLGCPGAISPYTAEVQPDVLSHICTPLQLPVCFDPYP